MVDYASMSDEELRATIQRERAELNAQKNIPAADYASMSDDELRATIRRERASLFPPAPKEEPGLLSGAGDYVLDIGRKLKSGTGKTISSLGWLGGLEGMEKYGTEMSEAGEAAMTPLGAERSKRPIFTALDNPELLAEREAQIRAGAQNVPFGDLVNFNPSGLAKIPYAIAESTPGMALGMGAAFVAPKLIPTAGQIAIGSLAVRALGPLARSVPKSPAALAKFGAQVVGTGTIASAEALQGGAMSGQQTEKEALAYLTKNPGALQESEGGLAALEETNGDVDAAAKLLAARMGMEAFYKVGAATGILSLPGAALQSRLTAGVANKGLLKEAGIGAVGEGSQEGPQSAAEAFFSGDIMGQIDPSKKPTLGGVLSAGLEGALIGAPMGGGMGVIGSVLSSKKDPATALDELEAAVRDMINSRDEQVRARAQQYLAEINEARQLLLPAPPKTIGGKPFGGEDIIDVARAQPDLVRGWRQILEDPEIKTADQMRQALLRAAGQEPKPNIRGQRYDTDALASENLVPPSTTEEGAAGEYNPLGGLSDAKIVGFAETNRETNNPTVNAILDQPTTTNIEKARLIRDFYLKEYGPNYETLLGIPETRFDDATIASSNQLSALGLMDINARNRAEEAAQAAAARIAAAQEETRKTLEAASATLRPSTRERTGEAGVEAMRQATETSGRGNAPYTGPNDPSVTNYIRNLPPNTPPSVALMTSELGLTVAEAQDAIKGNTGQNRLLVMRMGVPTTRPKRGPGAPDTTASSPLGAATNIEDMTGTRRTDLSETAGEGTAPTPSTPEPFRNRPIDRLNRFISRITGGGEFNFAQAQAGSRGGMGEKAATKAEIDARMQELVDSGEYIRYGNGIKKVATEDDVRRIIDEAPDYTKVTVNDIATKTGLPFDVVASITERLRPDTSAPMTTRGQVRQSENTLVDTGNPFEFWKKGPPASDPNKGRKTQRSVAGGTSPNLDRVLAESAAKNGQTQPQTTAQTDPADQPTPLPGGYQPEFTSQPQPEPQQRTDENGNPMSALEEFLREIEEADIASGNKTREQVETDRATRRPDYKFTGQETAERDTERQQPKAKPQPKPQPTAQPKPAAQPQQASSPEEDIVPTPSLGGTAGAQAIGASGATAGQEAPQGASAASGTNAYAPTSKEALAKARKVVAEKLRQLRASGKVGAEVANRVSQLLKDPNFDVEQIMRSFAVADALSKTFGGTDANLRVEFYREILEKDPTTDKFIHVAGEAGASVGDVRGLIKISLSKDLSASLARDTAFHEGFHFLQDMINEYDPKTAKFLFGKRIGSDPNNGRGVYAGGAFRDGMTLDDIDPTIKRSLQNAAPEKGGPSYWDVLNSRYDSSGSVRSDFADQREAVAYVFGALADARNNGSQLGGLKPAFRRFLNMLTQFAQNLRNAFRGYGYTNTNEILSKFASGKKQKGYGRDIEGDFSGSTGQRRTQRSFVGRNSENWPFQKQRLAEAMEDQGFTPMQVWKSTGLHRGDEDGLWRNEIPDFKAKLNITPEISVRDGEDTLGNILKHDDLFQEYPFLEYVDIFTSNQLEEGSALTTDDGDIYISGRDVSAINSGYMNKRDLAARKKELISSILHEVQHVIQRREGFKTGSSAARERDKIEETIHDEMRIIRDAYEDAERPLYNAIRSLERVIASEFPDGDKFDAVNVIRFLKTGKDLYRGKHKDLEAAVIKKYLPQSKIEKINGALWDNEAYGITVKDLEEGLANSYLGNAFANYMKVSGERESRDVQYRFEGRVRKEPPQAILERENLQNIIRTHDEIAAEVAIEYENGFKELLEKLKADNEQYAREIGPSKTALKRLDVASRRAWKKSMSEWVAEEETQPQKSTYQRSVAGENGGVPEGTSKVGISADIKRIIDLFGPKMYSSGMANVTAKELLQNSFDGLKSAYATGRLEQGSGVIDIASDRNNRIIVISDNGAGMSPETVRDAFLTIAGTNKEGLAVGDASGGFGVAKMAFIFGNERLILNTVKDGVRTTLDTNGNELLDGNADIKVEPTDDMNGTAILIKVPETYTNSAGNQEKISFPNRPRGFDVFQKPLIGNVDIFGREDNFDMSTLSPDMLREYALSSYYNEHPNFKKQMNIGNKQPIEDTPLMTTARFPWGDIQIYYGEKKTDYPITNVLSSGLYQFSTTVPKLGEMFKSIPYDVILNVRSRVEPDSADYPFNKQREDFNKKISTDISALKRYLSKIANTRDAEDVGSNFTDIKNIRRVPYISPEDLSSMNIDAGLFDLIDPELRKSLPERKKQDVSAEFVDVKNGVVLKDGKELANASSTYDQINDENAYIDLKKFTIPERDVPSDLPAFHNNLNIDPIEEAVRREGADEIRTRYFVSRIATVFQNFARSISEIDRHAHWQKMYGAPVGVSFDKDYLGCYVMVPYRGMFVNPASAKGQGVKAIAESFIHTMMHEAAHDISMQHDEDFAKGMARLYTEIEDVDPDLVDNMREEMRQLVKEYMPEFKALRSVIYAADVENVQSDAWRIGKLGRSIDTGGSGDRAKSGPSGERNRRELGGDNEGDQSREGGEGLRRGAEEAGGVGKKTQRAWVGEKAASWDPALQKAAERLERDGSDWKNVYWKTGLHRGKKDGKWRVEIPDVGAEIDDNIVRYLVNDTSNATVVKLSDVYDHPDIYREYPFLRDIEFSVLPKSKDTNVSGNADPYRNKIGVAIDYLEHHLLGSKAKYPDVVRRILTHEIQHFIQHHEGFTFGSSAEQILDDAEKKSASLKENADDTFRSKVEDVVDEINKNTNRYLFNDIRKKYPDLRINLEASFKDQSKDPVLYNVSGSSASPIKGDRADKILAEIKAHPDMAKVEAVQDAYARALDIYNNIVVTIDGEISDLTPEVLQILYRGVYGERESRDTEGRLALKTKGERAGTLPGEMDYAAKITPDRDGVFDAALYRNIEDGSFLDPESAELKKISRAISSSTMLGKLTNAFKTQRSVAGDTDAYAFKRGSIADTNTMAFKRWFKNSVVRAPDTFKMIIDPKTGQRIREAIMVPLKVYHGGSFMRGRDIPMMGRKDGPDFPYDFMHFGTKASALARTSAFSEAEAEAKGLDITPAYLSIQKPKYVKDQGTTAKWSKVVEQAKAEGYDGLIYTNEYEDVGSTSYVIFDPGQAKSTDNVGTFNFADPRMERAFAGKRPNPPKKSIADLDKNLQEIRDAGGRKGFINTGKRAAALSNWITSKFDPKGTLPKKDVYRILKNFLMGNIKAIEVAAAARSRVINKGTKAERRQIFDYLKTKNAVLPNTMPAELRDMAIMIKQEIAYIGRQLIAKGILTQKQVDANEGAYLPVMYMQYLKESETFGSAFRGSRREYAMRKSDIPEEIRKAMGEIMEPGLPYMKAAVVPVRDMAIIDFLSDIASFEDAEWVAKGDLVDWRGTKVSPFWLSEQMRDVRDNMLYFQDDPTTLATMKKVADEMQAIIDKTDMREDVGKNFKRLPNTSRYGALRGMAVRKEIYQDIVGMGVYTGDLDFFSKLFSSGGAIPKAVNTWKLSKTVFSPTTHCRQLFSNMIVADISGINLHDIPVRMVQAIDDMINDTGGWKIAKDNGVTATGVVDAEMKAALKDLKKMANAATGGVFSVVDLNKWSDHWITKLSPSNLYQGSDYLFKTMKIIDEMKRYEKKLGPPKNDEDRKLREGAAVLEANEWFMDYSDVHDWVKTARQTWLPFVTYQYKIMPKIAETMLKNPQRFAPYVALFYALPALATAMMDLDEEDIDRLKNATKSYVRKNPHALPLAWKDASGDFQFLDVGYLFPWSFMSGLVVSAYNAATGEGPFSEFIKATTIFGSPVLTVAAAFSNLDTFTGKEIINKYDTPMDQAKDVLGYIWGLAMPPILTNYGAIGAPVADWFSGDRSDIDRKGNPKRDTSQLFAQAFGFNIYPVNPAQQFAQNVMMMQNDINRAKADLSSVIRDLSMSTQRRRETIDKRTADIQRRIREMQKYIDEARPTERLLKK